MARNMTIELIRPSEKRHTTAIVAVCVLVLLCMMPRLSPTAAYFAASDNARHVFVLESGVKISLTEDWGFKGSELNLAPGLTVVKRPTVTNKDGSCYMRALVKITDSKTGKVLDPSADAERLRLILGTIWRDPNNSLNAGGFYSIQDIQALAGKGVTSLYNSRDFAAPVYLDGIGSYSFEYKGVMQNGVMSTLFDKVVVPADYDQNDFALMGDYTISVQAQAIQANGFSSQEQAMGALNVEGGM